MGRHRRVHHVPDPGADSDSGHQQRGSHRKRSAVPVRTGLLGASAAMAVGAVAVASGLVPAPYGISGGGQHSGRVEAGGPTDLQSQGMPSSPATSSPGVAGRSSGDAADRAGTDSASATPSKSDSTRPSAPGSSRTASGSGSAGDRADSAEKSSASPSASHNSGGGGSGSPHTGTTTSASTESAAEAAVLTLVNQERGKAGCRPVTADTRLAALAGDFSDDMAERGFFSHITPEGESPWDRAKKAGIDNLGGENIARGQADAKSVMASWMSSPGHKANILNCDYRTLGVGAHFAQGGPWWTQDFGF